MFPPSILSLSTVLFSHATDYAICFLCDPEGKENHSNLANLEDIESVYATQQVNFQVIKSNLVQQIWQIILDTKKIPTMNSPCITQGLASHYKTPY